MTSIIALLKCYFSGLLCFLCFILLTTNKSIIHARNIDHHNVNENDGNSCESIRQLFDSLNMSKHLMKFDSSSGGGGGVGGAGGGGDISSSIGSSNNNHDTTGLICGGNCCDAQLEKELTIKSTNNFNHLLIDHIKDLRNSLESTAKMYKEHILELSYQSQNKTLNLFSQVYRRMAPLSKQSILELYKVIRDHFTPSETVDFEFEIVVKNFFIKLFPVAYHHAVHSSSDITIGDFHNDYKNCLMHMFDDLQPFGNIPNILNNNLKESLGTATVFVSALDKAADVLLSTEQMYIDSLTGPCKEQLMKIHYCSACKGINGNSIKPCHSYCVNVMRGCLMLYIRDLDKPWTQTVVTVENLWHQSINTDHGIEDSIKNIDIKLSEAIMQAMENGPELEKKVQKACGPTPTPNDKYSLEETLVPSPMFHEWASPPSTEMLQLLVKMDVSKDLYSHIVDSICRNEDEYKQSDDHCWTGERIGNYTFPVQKSSVDKQQYNPEVPLEKQVFVNRNNNHLSELSDELMKVRHQVMTAMITYIPSPPYSDVQSDMARNDEEGSGDGINGGRGGYDIDDEEDGNFIGISGDGSGDDEIQSTSRNSNNNSNISSSNNNNNNYNNNNNNNNNSNNNNNTNTKNINGCSRIQFNLIIYLNLYLIYFILI